MSPIYILPLLLLLPTEAAAHERQIPGEWEDILEIYIPLICLFG